MTIADLIAERGYRHDYIARRLGLSVTQFSRITTGKTPLSVSRIYQLAEVLRLPVRDVAAVVIPEINEEQSHHATGSPA